MFSPASLPIYDRAKGPSQALYGLGMGSLMTGQEKVLGRENIPTYCRSLTSLNMPFAARSCTTISLHPRLVHENQQNVSRLQMPTVLCSALSPIPRPETIYQIPTSAPLLTSV